VTSFAAFLLAGTGDLVGAQSDGATYTYDALGRLIQVTYANGTTGVDTYDAGENPTSVVVTPAPDHALRPFWSATILLR
jgi:YD repeat-containing protein